MYTIDTNILIYYANAERTVVEFLFSQLEKDALFIIPTIVVVEFFSFPKITPEARKVFEFLFPYFRIIPLSYSVSIAAAELKAKNGMKLADSVIAATAMHTKSTLVTRNIRDFKKIPGLQLFQL